MLYMLKFAMNVQESELSKLLIMFHAMRVQMLVKNVLQSAKNFQLIKFKSKIKTGATAKKNLVISEKENFLN